MNFYEILPWFMFCVAMVAWLQSAAQAANLRDEVQSLDSRLREKQRELSAVWDKLRREGLESGVIRGGHPNGNVEYPRFKRVEGKR